MRISISSSRGFLDSRLGFMAFSGSMHASSIGTRSIGILLQRFSPGRAKKRETAVASLLASPKRHCQLRSDRALSLGEPMRHFIRAQRFAKHSFRLIWPVLLLATPAVCQTPSRTREFAADGADV